MKDAQAIQQDSPGWMLFVVLSFMISISATSLGVLILPVDLWVKGYIAMGMYFTISSSFMLAKMLRDNHESNKLITKLDSAKTQKMLKELDLAS